MDPVSSFYDALAPEYDRMVDFEQRFVKEQSQFRSLIRTNNIKTALDVGCGTGFHSLLLASLGVKVTSIDSSKEMLVVLRKHAEEMGVELNVIESSIEEMSNIVLPSFDAIFLLGNTLPHLPSNEEIIKTFRTFKSLLRRGGMLIIQALNYRRILAGKERIQSIKIREGKTYVRFYDFLEKTIRFNILTIERQGENITHNLRTTGLFPIIDDELSQWLTVAGFQEISQYENLARSPYDKLTSKDLVLFAR